MVNVINLLRGKHLSYVEEESWQQKIYIHILQTQKIRRKNLRQLASSKEILKYFITKKKQKKQRQRTPTPGLPRTSNNKEKPTKKERQQQLTIKQLLERVVNLEMRVKYLKSELSITKTTSESLKIMLDNQ